jgi:glycosyltransferase involved in cell wall biosynthesis
VPCYNYGRYLRQCVNSILAQEVDLNIDVIDDASDDDTQTVGTALAAEDGRVTYTRHERNIGHIATYNEGLDRAVGTYSLLLSADDMLAPGALRRAIDVLDERSDVALLYGEVLQFQDIPPDVPSLAHPAVHIWEGAEFVARCCTEVWNPISTPGAIVRTSVQKSVGGYLPSLPHAGDREMWLRLATRGRVAELRGAVQAFYRVHDNNMHRKWFYDFLVNDREFRTAYETFFADSAPFIENYDELRLQCSRGLAERGIWWSYHKLRLRQFRGALECLRYSVSIWEDLPEDEIGIRNVTDVVKPLSYAVLQRHHRKREAKRRLLSPIDT